MDIGQQIGPYKIESLLGQGGMAEVYKAWHTGLHRYEALKVPLGGALAGSDATFVGRFLGEARMAARLHHPNIAAIHAVSEATAAQHYFAMEWVDGCPLDDLLAQRPTLPLAEALSILQQVAAALDYAHAQGIIHRDIKPGNILLAAAPGDKQWAVKVVDFGISRSVEEQGGTRMTRTGMIVGTPQYMSPEQAGSGQPVDHRTDIYALGVVAYEMLCGRPPFQSDHPMSVIANHLRDAPPLARQFNAALPAAVEQALQRALAKEPSQRFNTAAEFVATLTAERPPLSATFPTSRWRTPAMVGVAVVSGVTLVGYGIVHSINGSNDHAITLNPLPAKGGIVSSGFMPVPKPTDAPQPTDAPTPTPTLMPPPAVPDLKGIWDGNWPWHKAQVPATLAVTGQSGSDFDGVLSVTFASGLTRVRVSGSTGPDHHLLLREEQLLAQAPGEDWAVPDTDHGVFASDWQSASGHIENKQKYRWFFHKLG